MASILQQWFRQFCALLTFHKAEAPYNLLMSAITPREARAYLARWKLVNELQTAEMHAASLETRLRQLASLTASRNLYPEDPRREQDVREVRERWARIRQFLQD